MHTRRAVVLTLAALAAMPALARPPNPKRTPGVEVGAEAPDFTLRMLNSDETVQLSKVIGKRPVVLVFGSYT